MCTGVRSKHLSIEQLQDANTNTPPFQKGLPQMGVHCTLAKRIQGKHKFKAAKEVKMLQSQQVSVGIVISQLCPSADVSAGVDLQGSAGVGAELLQNIEKSLRGYLALK